MTLTPSPNMLDFVFELILNSELTDEERRTVLELELLNRKLKVLSGVINKKNPFPTEEAFQMFYSMEGNLGKELKGMLEGWREMTGRLRVNDPFFGGGSPGTVRFAISRPRGVSSGARDKELRYLQKEEECYKEAEEPKEEEMGTLMLDARIDVNCAWICGHMGKEDNWKIGSGDRQRRTMDRGEVG